MQRIVSCTLIMALSLVALLAVMSGTGAEAATPAEVEAARLKMLEEDRQTGTKILRAEEARRAEELRKAKEAGFTTLSEAPMNYNDAVTFCHNTAEDCRVLTTVIRGMANSLLLRVFV